VKRTQTEQQQHCCGSSLETEHLLQQLQHQQCQFSNPYEAAAATTGTATYGCNN
jgi:hypothetical protein